MFVGCSSGQGMSSAGFAKSQPGSCTNPGRIDRPAAVLAGRVLAVYRHPQSGTPGRRDQGPAGRLARPELDRRLAEMAAHGGDPKPVNVSTRLVADVRQALSGRCLLPASVEMPSWVDGAIGPTPGNIIPLANGLLDVATGMLLPHTPAYSRRRPCPMPKTPPPRFRGRGWSSSDRFGRMTRTPWPRYRIGQLRVINLPAPWAG